MTRQFTGSIRLKILAICVCGVFMISGNPLHKSDNLLVDLDKQHLTFFPIESESAYDSIISVESQEDFDNLSSIIPEKVQKHKNILIIIKEGCYFSHSNHILINDQTLPDCRLAIKGSGNVTIMATSKNLIEVAKKLNTTFITDYYHTATVNPNDIFTDGKKLITLSVKDDSINSGVTFVKELFEKINPTDKKNFSYRLKSDLLPNMSNKECRNLWLWATHSWISSYEKIDSVANGYIYLTANKDIELYQCPLNTDYKSWRVMPRIKIVNQQPSNNGVYIDQNGLLYFSSMTRALYKCDQGSFLSIKNSTLKSIEVSNINFIGGNAPLININSVTEFACIHDCNFNCQQDVAIKLRTNNGLVKNNSFQNSMTSVIEIPNEGYRNHEISSNSFNNCGNRLLNKGCIAAAAENVHIYDNVFHNNLIAAVNVGVWHGATPQGKISSIIEDNLIYNDSTFLKDYMGNSLLDVALLYVYTKNDMAIIRRNRIHGLRTIASGNGIYVDDGAYNVSLYDNLVTHIDGKLYNINCRAQVSDQVKKDAPAYSTNNFIANNIVDGPIRYEVRDDDTSMAYHKSIYGGTYFLTTDSVNFQNKFININSSEDKFFKTKNLDLIIKLSSASYNELRRDARPEYLKFINKWVKK